MKNKSALALLSLAASAVLCVACATKPKATEPAVEPQPTPAQKDESAPAAEPQTTVETIFIDGKLHTGYIFKELSGVSVYRNDSDEAINVSPENLLYNKATSELSFKDVDWGNAERYAGARFVVTGTVADATQFYLYGNNAQFAPLIAVDGETLATSAYSFDNATKLLTVTAPLDVEHDSYLLCWECEEYGMVALSNLTEQFQETYEALVIAWEASHEQQEQK